MDRDERYRTIVKRILQEVADITPSDENIRTEFVCDETLGHYQIGQVGWERKRRVDEVFIHIDVIEGKVWLQHDGTNLRLAEDLVRAGIPKEHIVLAPSQPATGYRVRRRLSAAIGDGAGRGEHVRPIDMRRLSWAPFRESANA